MTGFRRYFKPLLILFSGVAIGVTAGVLAFYTKPAVSRIDSVKRRLGFESYWGKFTQRFDAYKASDWPGVTSPTSPIWKVRRGYDVQLVKKGFTFPVNISFYEGQADGEDAPLFYVNELHGTIKYVARDGSIHIYAENLNNFEPFPIEKSDEMGLSGMLVLPGTEDLIVTGSYTDSESGLLSNHILRLTSEPGGRRMASQSVILDLKEFTSPSNQIQQVVIGPDEKLYVSVGDAENHKLSLDRTKFGGKILRLNLDGTACEDNPFYVASLPDSPESYVFAYGIRNAFDMDFSSASGQLFAVDNGKNLDRLFHVQPGSSYGWDGVPDSIRTNSLYTWGPVGNTAPVGMTFLRNGVMGEGSAGHCYIATYGPAAELGQNYGKSILQCIMHPQLPALIRSPEPVVQYQGELATTILGLAEGPDGIYFTDFFGEATSGLDATGTGGVWKLMPSKATLGLPDTSEVEMASLSSSERGQILFSQFCRACHRIEGNGGHEGPELTHVIKNLDLRLNSQAYESELARLLASQNPFMKEQRGFLEEVQKTKGQDRIKIWIWYHLIEPRFDNLYAKMPRFSPGLTDDQRRDIVAFLLKED